MISSALIAFLVSFDELMIALFLSSPTMTTLPIGYCRSYVFGGIEDSVTVRSYDLADPTPSELRDKMET